jgi:hypothetical protein
MSDTKFEWIGHCYNEAENHDKVYAVVWAEGTYYSAWGRRGAKLQFKALTRIAEATKTICKKKKTYKDVDEFVLFSVFPDFKEKLEEMLIMATLSGKVR